MLQLFAPFFAVQVSPVAVHIANFLNSFLLPQNVLPVKWSTSKAYQPKQTVDSYDCLLFLHDLYVEPLAIEVCLLSLRFYSGLIYISSFHFVSQNNLVVLLIKFDHST